MDERIQKQGEQLSLANLNPSFSLADSLLTAKLQSCSFTSQYTATMNYITCWWSYEQERIGTKTAITFTHLFLLHGAQIRSRRIIMFHEFIMYKVQKVDIFSR